MAEDKIKKLETQLQIFNLHSKHKLDILNNEYESKLYILKNKIEKERNEINIKIDILTNKQFYCFKCEFACLSQEELDKHKKKIKCIQKHNGNIIKCKHCNRLFPNEVPNVLNYGHGTTVESQKIKQNSPYWQHMPKCITKRTCKNCNETFNFKTQYFRHIKTCIKVEPLKDKRKKLIIKEDENKNLHEIDKQTEDEIELQEMNVKCKIALRDQLLSEGINLLEYPEFFYYSALSLDNPKHCKNNIMNFIDEWRDIQGDDWDTELLLIDYGTSFEIKIKFGDKLEVTIADDINYIIDIKHQTQNYINNKLEELDLI